MSHKRFPSAIFPVDEEDDHKDNVMDMEFSTPTAKEIRSNATQLTATSMITTNELQIPIPSSTPIRLSSTKRKATIKKEIELIDLVTPMKSSIHLYQSNYIPRTLPYYNQQRLSILPTFPAIIYNNNSHLLLANVPMDQLSSEELARRETGKCKCSFIITDPDPPTASYMVHHYHTMFGSVLQRFKIDLAILDHNYARLDNFLKLFRTARRRLINAKEYAQDLLQLEDNEKPQLLEFYLQMDVDLFYMKTCSFRDAQPRSITEGIFCSTIPECRYTMTRCGNCKLCSTSMDNQYHQQAPVLFNRFERYRFVNGYESILNCPVTCNTKNFIYVLTCVCGQYDYISETKFTFDVRYNGHCIIGNNIIRKFLVGEKNLKNIPSTKKYASATSSQKKENMLLYKHLMQCSAAIQMFLDKNAYYWPFVPMSNEEAAQDNINHHRMRTTTTTFNPGQNRDIQCYLDNISKPPQGYRFSKHQIEQQMAFFRKNIIKELFDEEVHIYNAAIIAVLPPYTSDLFRHIVHSLFVTHTEAKLNTLGHVFDCREDMNIRHGQWCANLVRRSVSS
ncbi:unnamed protein product [Rotaria socialis]|uniref:Uncharacterized protein n=1 Tax=Rotaria socialis TaxID=392032 RepID=A0A821GQH9_9BILA|nr:unnamed protein product [Rotaria socialis]CAF3329354.1 unnamed protein product [Rotaria socialis]CAF3539857.1 unnamed protein product [Rotaria socialis]CAF4302220.1 unnamed protein product [Rotaria socialis]CAF4396622.1 unnamed protein product [Rotaria socialis]